MSFRFIYLILLLDASSANTKVNTIVCFDNVSHKDKCFESIKNQKSMLDHPYLKGRINVSDEQAFKYIWKHARSVECHDLAPKVNLLNQCISKAAKYSVDNKSPSAIIIFNHDKLIIDIVDSTVYHNISIPVYIVVMSEKEVVANFKKRSGWVDSMNVNDSRNVPLIFQDLDTIGRCPVINGEKIQNSGNNWYDAMAGLGETLIGHKSLLRCPGGFISQANSEIYVKCIPNPKDNILGQWDTYTSFLCTPLECNPLFLPKFEHSKMTIPPLPVTVYSTGVTITCVENYYLNTSVITNSIEIKCVYSSPSKAVMWDIPNFKCIETKCSLSKSVAIHSNIYGELLSLLSNSNTLVPVGHSFSYYCPRYFYNRDQNKNDVDFQCVRPKDQFVAHPSPDIEEEILSKCERKQCNTADFGTENWYKIDCHMVTILRCTRGKTLNFYGEISQSLSAICNCSSAITAGGSFFHKNKVIQKQKCSDLKCYRRNINEIPNSNYQDLPLETLANQKITVVCKQGFYIKNSEPKQSKKDMTCILKKTYSQDEQSYDSAEQNPTNLICEETKCDVQVFLKQHNELEIVSQTDNELPIGKSAEFQCKKGSRFIDGKTKIKPLTCSILNSEEMIASFSNTSESLCETIQCPGKEDLKSVTDKINVEILSIATNIAGKLEYQCIKDFKFLNFGALTRNTICVEKFENNKLEAEWQNGLTGCDQIYCQGIPKAPENSVVKKYAGFNISGNVKDGYFVANSNYYFSVSSNNSRSKFSGSFKCVQDGRTPIAKQLVHQVYEIKEILCDVHDRFNVHAMNASKDVSVNTAVNFSCVDGTRFVRNHQEYNVFNCLPYDAQLYAQFSPLIEKDSCEVVHCKKINASEYFGDITSSGKQILNDTLNFECYENFKIEKTSDKFGTKYESKCLPDETNDTYILIWLPRLKICEKIECPANTKNASVPHAIVKDNIVFAGESTTYAPERGYFFEDGIEGSFKCIQESINDQRTIYAQQEKKPPTIIMIRCEDIPPKIFSNDSFAFTLQNETKFDTVIRYYCAAGYSFDDNIKSISSACEIDTKTNVSASWSIPLISKNFNCIDIDECLLNKTICSNDLHISAIECNNIKGSYICECSRGRQKRVNVTTVPCIASPSANITLIQEIFDLNGKTANDFCVDEFENMFPTALAKSDEFLKDSKLYCRYMVTASFATSDQDLLLYIGSNWNGDNGSLSNRPDFKLGYYQPRADNVSSKKSGLQWWWIVIACCVVLFFVVSFVIIKCLPKSNEKIRDSISSTCTDFPDLLSDEEKPEIMVLRENLLEEDSMNGANMTNGPPFNDL